MVPMLVTVYVAYLIFSAIDGVIPSNVPGLGFVVTLALITFVGFLASTMLGGLFVYVEGIFARLPLLKILYNAVKDLFNAFAGEKKKFDQPVTVQLMEGSQARFVGFVTQQDLAHMGLAGDVAVYCPHSYNFSGQLIVAPRKLVTPLNADSSAVMSFVVSGGVAGS
jgi:uncharacterized membrane protein